MNSRAVGRDPSIRFSLSSFLGNILQSTGSAMSLTSTLVNRLNFSSYHEYYISNLRK